MTQPTQTRAYLRKDDGTLEITTLAIVDGEVCDKAGYPLTPTHAMTNLMGWPDHEARVYVTDGGVEVLVAIDIEEIADAQIRDLIRTAPDIGTLMPLLAEDYRRYEESDHQSCPTSDDPGIIPAVGDDPRNCPDVNGDWLRDEEVWGWYQTSPTTWEVVTLDGSGRVYPIWARRMWTAAQTVSEA